MKRNSTKPPKPLPPTRIVLHGSNVYCFLAIQASSAGRAPHCWCAIQTLRVTFQHARAEGQIIQRDYSSARSLWISTGGSSHLNPTTKGEKH